MERERVRRAAIGTGAVVVGVAILSGYLNVSWPTIVAFLLGAAVYHIARIFVVNAYRRRRTVRRLRQFDAARRAAILETVRSPAAREYYAERLREEGEPEVGGIVERYPFSPTDRRAMLTAHWLAVGAAIAAVVWLFRIPPDIEWERIACLVAVVAAAVVGVVARSQSRQLDTVIEVSAYNIVEVQPDGVRQGIRWGGALRLRRRRWLGRWELSPLGAPRSATLVLDPRRVGFDRLIGRILYWGGFLAPAGAGAGAGAGAPPPATERDTHASS
jgi:hypothetical protein